MSKKDPNIMTWGDMDKLHRLLLWFLVTTWVVVIGVGAGSCHQSRQEERRQMAPSRVRYLCKLRCEGAVIPCIDRCVIE